MILRITPGQTSRSIYFRIYKDTGYANATPLVYNSSNLAATYTRDNGTETAIALITLSSITAAYSSGGFIHRTNGVYRLDLPDAAIAAGAKMVSINIADATDIRAEPIVIQLDSRVDDLVGAQLPSANARANGGLPTVDASNQVKSRITAVVATTLTETTAGNLAAALIKLLDVATPLLTVGANPPANWLNAGAFAAGALNGKGDWLTTLGAAAPAGWLNSAAIATNALTAISTAIEGHLIDDADGQQLLASIVAKINATDVDLAGLSAATIASAVLNLLLSNATTPGTLGYVLAAVASDYMRRTDTAKATDTTGAALATAAAVNAIPAPPTAIANRQEMDANSTMLASIQSTAEAIDDRVPDAPASEDNATANKAAVIAAIGAPLQTGDYTEPNNAGIAAIRAKTDNLPDSPASTADVQVTAGPVTVVIAPLQATANTEAYGSDTMLVAQGSAPAISWTIQDAAGGAVDLSGKTIRFVAGIEDAPLVAGRFQYATGGSGIVIGGDDNNVATVTFNASDTAEPGVLACWLWNITDNLLLRKVSLTIEPSLKQIA